jgi:CDP-diacylglycerol pyrophosphatase
MDAARHLIAAIASFAAVACAPLTPPLPPAPAHPNGQVLWRILHEQCVPGERDRHDPSPCAVVSLEGGEAAGFVVLKDRSGVAQQLLMPTAKITGIEDPAVLRPDATNYFAKAWDERGLVEGKLGRPLPRTQVSIAVNSVYGRSQDQLHLHIDCLDKGVAAALRAEAALRPGNWSGAHVTLKGHSYEIRWLNADKLAATNPFRLLAQESPGAAKAMGAWTIAVVGAERPDGTPGFLLLADRADPAHGDDGSAEELQDHACS